MSDNVIMADKNTLKPEFALVAKRQPLELSTPLNSFGYPLAGYPKPPGAAWFVITSGRAQTTKSTHVCPSAGNDISASVAC
jgi:hypothetical protein